MDEAPKLLDGLDQRWWLRVKDVFAPNGALAMLNRALGQREAADSFCANLEQFVEEEGDARLLAQAKRRVKCATAECAQTPPHRDLCCDFQGNTRRLERLAV